MSDSTPFFDISFASINHFGEELCGDQVKIAKTPKRTIVVLSDGLGSGVKASILARLTAEIIVTMFRAGATTADVMETVIGTLPVCRSHNIAYAAFVLLELIHADGTFRVISFDTPPPLLLTGGRLASLERHGRDVRGRTLLFSRGRLGLGDALGLFSDGIPHASASDLHDFRWGRPEIGRFLEETLRFHACTASEVSRRVLRGTNRRYKGKPSDDATFVTILARPARSLMVFTGPPLDEASDEACSERLLGFPGRKIVCGGTTGDIIGAHLGVLVETDTSTGRLGIPPIGRLPGINLVTEGILTLAATLRLLEASSGSPDRLPGDHNGAALLARELLQADSIHFLVGERVNPYYQNPLLPLSMSIRRNLVTQLIERLEEFRKNITVEWY